MAAPATPADSPPQRAPRKSRAIDRPMNGALCVRVKRNGEPCKLHPVRGATVCHKHGGKAPQVKGAGLARQELAELGRELQLGTRELDTSPAEALIHVLRVAAFDAALLQGEVDKLLSEPEPDTYIRDEDGKLESIQPGKAALYGPTFHLTGIYTGEGKPHVVWAMHEQAQERLHKISVSCLKANIDERRTEVLEAKAKDLAEFGRAFALEVGLSPADPHVRQAMRKSLALISGRPQPDIVVS